MGTRKEQSEWTAEDIAIAKDMHNTLARKHGFPSWANTTPEIREIWLETVAKLKAVYEQMIYES